MNGQPNLLRRADRSGWPLLVARVVLGGMFIWMGAAKTGYPELILEKAGLWDKPWVQKIIETGHDDQGLIELGGPVQFLKIIREYDMFPGQLWFLLNFTTVAMPWVEVLCGLMLVLGVGVRGAAGVLVALLVMFTTMITIRGVNIYQAKDIAFCAIQFNCGCGGGEVFICNKIVENATLTLLAVVCLFSKADRFCVRKNVIRLRNATAAQSGV
jgi:uncharacterized membrane protein YphA (DoxX/SURF4 family)